MTVVVGLGNPGEKFEKTRHNLGFMAVEEFQKENNFPEFHSSRKLNTLISQGSLGNKKIILAKPQTFMNLSGKSVKSLTTNYKIQNTNLLVVHDDIDLPLGKIKISKGQSSAGHKGVESIIQELGVKNFIRIRIGIQPKTGKPQNVDRFVLQRFNKEEEGIVQEIIKKSCLAIEATIKEGLETARQKYNQYNQ